MTIMENFIKGLKENIDALENAEIRPDTNLASAAGWDSLAALSAMAFIASEYGVNLTAREISAAATPEKIFEIIQSKK